MNLIALVEQWYSYWQTVVDPVDAERRFRHLHWLNEFAFSSESTVSLEEFRVIQQFIEVGEKKIVELNGYVESPSEAVSAFEQPPEFTNEHSKNLFHRNHANY